MPTPIEIVRDFIALWETPDGFPQAVDQYFTPRTVWENHGLITTSGPDEALGFYREFSDQTGMTGMKIDILAIAAAGDKVLTERIDWILDENGAAVMKVPVMGIFEVADGRITAWRDYFDTIANAPPAAPPE
jgi:limonene-1,2-epoxide hydrolase